MNQILYTGGKNNGAMELKKVIRIFVIGILIYGLACLGEGSYATVKWIQERNNRIVDPDVTIEQIETNLKLDIKHKTAIDKIIYIWNEEPEVVLQGRGRKELTEQIPMPLGQNTLNLKIIDTKGHEVNYTNTYYAENIDKTAPEIELLVENAKVKIIAKDETQMSHISYYWNDEDETVIQAREDSPTQIEERVQIQKGENKLTIIAVDSSGNETTKEQTYIGATKPTITTFVENTYLVIRVTDEDNIQKIEYSYGNIDFTTDKENTGNPLNLKDAMCRQQLQPGLNTITIRAYNVSGLVTEEVVEVTI